MKKLMIAALAVATAGIASADDLCNETGVAAGCSVWNVKFSLKTLAAKKSACGDVLLANNGGIWTRYLLQAGSAVGGNNYTIGAGATAGENVANLLAAEITAGSNARWNNDAANNWPLNAANAVYPGSVYDRELETRKLYWMDNATRTWEGVLWQCESGCIDGLNGVDVNARVNFVMWEKKAKRAMSFPAFRARNAAQNGQASYRWFSVNRNSNYALFGGPAAIANEDRCFWFMGRYGQKATKIAVGWNPTVYPTYGFHAAGFGTFDAKNNRMSSVSGNCVGLIAPLVAGAEDDCGNGTRIFCQIAIVCQTFKQWCCDDCYYATDAVPASGTWSIKYNASLSKGTKPLSQIIPAYAVFSRDNYTANDLTAIRNAVAPTVAPIDPNTGVAHPATYALDAEGYVVKTPTAANESATLANEELDAVAATIEPAFLF